MSPITFDKNEISQLKDIIDRVEKGHTVIVSEISGIIDSVSNESSIVRSIEFGEEEFQVGVSLVSFVGRILQLTLPDAKYTVSVEQKLPNVTLKIDASEDDRLQVESVLERYCYILRGKSAMNTLFDDGDKAIIELKQKLDLSVLELGMAQEILDDSSVALPSDFENMQNNVIKLHQRIGVGLSRVAQLEHVVDMLLEQEQDIIHEALNTLKSKIGAPIDKDDIKTIQDALSHVEENEPDSFEKLQQSLNIASKSGQAGDKLVSWLVQINNIMPH